VSGLAGFDPNPNTERQDDIGQYPVVKLDRSLDRGGNAPRIGAHSVMDRPELVRRVAPPITMMAATKNIMKRSQYSTDLERE